MSWSSQKKNGGIFCTVYFVQRSFLIFVFYLDYIVLNTLSEYAKFYISKNIASYTFLLVFKIIEILKRYI